MSGNITKEAVKAETRLNNLRKRADKALKQLIQRWEEKEQKFLEKQPAEVVAILRLTGKLGQATVSISPAEEPFESYHEKQPELPGTEDPAEQAAQ